MRRCEGGSSGSLSGRVTKRSDDDAVSVFCVSVAKAARGRNIPPLISDTHFWTVTLRMSGMMIGILAQMEMCVCERERE